MQIIAKNAGGETDDSYDVLEAGFAEGATDSDLVMMFQRELSAGTWEGDPNTDDYFSNSYCITLRLGETVYGGAGTGGLFRESRYIQLLGESGPGARDGTTGSCGFPGTGTEPVGVLRNTEEGGDPGGPQPDSSTNGISN